MTSSNTRHALAKWEGERVAVNGILKEFRRKSDGIADILLVNCRVYRFDPDVILADTEPVFIDHMWDRYHPERGDNSGNPPTQLLTQYNSGGVVRQYTRRDSTIDYAVATEPCVRLDNALLRLIQLIEAGSVQDHRKKKKQYYEKILESLEAGVFVFSFGHRTNELLDFVRAELALIQADIAREAQAPANGRCRRLHAIKVPGRALKHSQGFA